MPTEARQGLRSFAAIFLREHLPQTRGIEGMPVQVDVMFAAVGKSCRPDLLGYPPDVTEGGERYPAQSHIAQRPPSLLDALGSYQKVGIAARTRCRVFIEIVTDRGTLQQI